MLYKEKKGETGFYQRINLILAEFYGATPAQRVAERLRFLQVSEEDFRTLSNFLEVPSPIVMEVCNAIRDLERGSF